MIESIIFRQEKINNIIHTFVIDKWPKEIMIAHCLLNNFNSFVQKIDNNIIITVENGNAKYTLIQMNIIGQYSSYELVESILIND